MQFALSRCGLKSRPDLMMLCTQADTKQREQVKGRRGKGGFEEFGMINVFACSLSLSLSQTLHLASEVASIYTHGTFNSPELFLHKLNP